METFKIVQVAHAFPPYIGGLSHVVEMLSKNLVAQGHEVEVVTLDPLGKLRRLEDFGGMRIRRFSCIAPLNSYFMPSPSTFLYLKSVKADIIHAHNIGALLVPACWLAIRNKLEKISFVVSPHHHLAGSTWHTKMFWKPYKPLVGHIIRSAHKVHCVSEFEARLVKEEFGVEPIVLKNGVADDVLSYSWNPPKDGLVLAYAGRLERYKRVHVLVEAASILHKQGYDVTLRIIGDGPELSNIIRFSRLLGVKMQHHHFLSRCDYLELLSTSSCFANLSQYEAFSIVVTEAVAMKLPAIASLPWGETFRGFHNVLLVHGNSPSEVAEAISNAMNMRVKEVGPILSWRDISYKLVREVYIPSLNH